MELNPFQLPVPCRSGRFCETCRDRAAGAEFRATNGKLYPEMYGPDFSCNFGLPWGHTGLAPWSARFNAMVREQMMSAAATEAANRESFGPGDVVKLVLARLGYRVHVNCGCEEFRQQMNAWGWRGSFRRRREILDWFTSKAREQGLKVDDASLWSLIRAGLKDLLKRRVR